MTCASFWCTACLLIYVVSECERTHQTPRAHWSCEQGYPAQNCSLGTHMNSLRKQKGFLVHLTVFGVLLCFFQGGCTKLTWSTQKIKRTDTTYFWSEYVSTGCCKPRYLKIFSRCLYRWPGNNSYVHLYTMLDCSLKLLTPEANPFLHRGFGTSITWNRGMFPKQMGFFMVGDISWEFLIFSVWKKSPCFVIYVKNW